MTTEPAPPGAIVHGATAFDVARPLWFTSRSSQISRACNAVPAGALGVLVVPTRGERVDSARERVYVRAERLLLHCFREAVGPQLDDGATVTSVDDADIDVHAGQRRVVGIGRSIRP